MEFRLLEKVWSGKEVKFSHLKVFGCVFYVHIDFDMYECCILGKQKNVSFLKTSRIPKAEKLELVHTNLWRPSLVASLGGSGYYIIFIDDSSKNI